MDATHANSITESFRGWGANKLNIFLMALQLNRDVQMHHAIDHSAVRPWSHCDSFSSRFSPKEWKLEGNLGTTAVANSFSLMNSLWFALGALMQQVM